MAPTTKILMLCGYTQNASIFRGRLAALRKSLPDNVEMVFVDPPHIVDMPTTNSSDFDSSASSSSSRPEDTPRCWWSSKDAPTAKDPQGKAYVGLVESLSFLRQTLEAADPPFAGIFGFSQGSAMAAILAAVMEKPDMSSAFDGWKRRDGEARWVVLSAGFRGNDRQVEEWFAQTQPLKIPSLHVLGRGDTIVGEDRTAPLVATFANARVEWHDGGHHTPSKASWRRFFKSFIVEADGDWDKIQALDGPTSGGQASL